MCESWWGNWINNTGLWFWQELKDRSVCWDKLKFGGGVYGTRKKKNSSSAAGFFFFFCRHISTEKTTETWNEKNNENLTPNLTILINFRPSISRYKASRHHQHVQGLVKLKHHIKLYCTNKTKQFYATGSQCTHRIAPSLEMAAINSA